MAVLSLAGKRDEWMALSDEDQEQVRGWLRLHDVDPNDVPLTGTIQFDENTREWVFPVYLRRDGVFYLDEDGEVAQGVVRRPWAADAPGPLLALVEA